MKEEQNKTSRKDEQTDRGRHAGKISRETDDDICERFNNLRHGKERCQLEN